jgi:hypothetical protein
MYDIMADLYVVLVKYVYGSGYQIVVLKQRYIHGPMSLLLFETSRLRVRFRPDKHLSCQKSKFISLSPDKLWNCTVK